MTVAAAPLLITVAPNGARRTRADHPALPILPAELAATAVACRDAGAAMIHIHVRDDAGGHSLDAERYRQAIAAIRAAVDKDLVIQVTTESVGKYDRAAQMALVRTLRPEAVSLAVRELIPPSDAVAETEAEAAAFLGWTRDAGVHVQYIVYDVGDLRRLQDLHRRGLIPDAHPFALYVLGRYGQADSAAPKDLIPFLAEPQTDPGSGPDDPDPPDSWAVCAFGRREGACALAAAAFGGHVRVGFENNLLLADGRPAADNADLVRQTAAGAWALGRRPMTADEARRRFRHWRDGRD